MAEQDERLQRAKRKVRRIRAFYLHALIWGGVCAGLLFINLMTWPGYLWSLWPAFVWGIGLAFHGLTVYGMGNIFGTDWEERKIQEILSREEQESKKKS